MRCSIVFLFWLHENDDDVGGLVRNGNDDDDGGGGSVGGSGDDANGNEYRALFGGRLKAAV